MFDLSGVIYLVLVLFGIWWIVWLGLAIATKARTIAWFLIISGNLLLGSLALACGAAGNPMVFVCSVGGIGMISASLYWVMFHIMDDY